MEEGERQHQAEAQHHEQGITLSSWQAQGSGYSSDRFLATDAILGAAFPAPAVLKHAEPDANVLTSFAHAQHPYGLVSALSNSMQGREVPIIHEANQPLLPLRTDVTQQCEMTKRLEPVSTIGG